MTAFKWDYFCPSLAIFSNFSQKTYDLVLSLIIMEVANHTEYF